MAVVEEVSNVTGDVAEQVYASVLQNLSPLITIFKAVGIVVLGYLVYLLIKGVLGWRHRNRVKNIEKKVNEIDRKLDELLKKDKKEKKRKK